jgi:hypothetical protein
MFHKGKFGYDFLREVVVNKTHWLDCRMAKWNFVGKFSYQETIVQMSKMGAQKEARIYRNSRKTSYKIDK